MRLMRAARVRNHSFTASSTDWNGRGRAAVCRRQPRRQPGLSEDVLLLQLLKHGQQRGKQSDRFAGSVSEIPARFCKRQLQKNLQMLCSRSGGSVVWDWGVGGWRWRPICSPSRLAALSPSPARATLGCPASLLRSSAKNAILWFFHRGKFWSSWDKPGLPARWNLASVCLLGLTGLKARQSAGAAAQLLGNWMAFLFHSHHPTRSDIYTNLNETWWIIYSLFWTLTSWPDLGGASGRRQ